MAKGASSKAYIEEKLLSTFDNSFIYGKEIRIPLIEDGSEVQIKITLTCAKTNVEPGEDTAIPGAAVNISGVQTSAFPTVGEQKIQATEAEKEAVKKLAEELHLDF